MAVVDFKRDEIVNNEIKEFTQRVQEVLSEGVTEDVQSSFKTRRLLQGVYGQRQMGEQMIRIKFPGGHLTTKQFRQVADIATKYSHGILHITTRQAVQLHYLKLPNLPIILDKLAEVNITSREGCGNTVRNVSSSPYAGLLRDQVFDVTPAVDVCTRFFLRNKDTQALPRKFKIAFSENKEDIGVTGMHDLGAIAVIKDGKPGFKIVVGGGLGSEPFAATIYSEFLPVDEIMIHFLAIARMFNQHGNREKRMKARIKFLVHKTWGIEKFKEECAKEIERIKIEGISFSKINITLTKPEEFDYSNPFDKAREAKEYLWFSKNVKPTIYANQYMVTVQVPLGDLTPETTHELCNLALTLKNNADENEHLVTFTDDQNLVLRNIFITTADKKVKFKALYDKLGQLKLNNIGSHDMSDPISCPGTSTCNLGITHSKGLARAIRDRVQDRLVDNHRYFGATIHMSGCPNSCGRHHIATIGFFGRSEQIDEETQAPAYGVLIGGGNKGDGVVEIGKRCNKILAKRIPDFIDALMLHYEKNAIGDETFVNFCYRISKEEVNTLLSTFEKENLAVTSSEKINYDWGKDEPYVVLFGEGECAT